MLTTNVLPLQSGNGKVSTRKQSRFKYDNSCSSTLADRILRNPPQAASS